MHYCNCICIETLGLFHIAPVPHRPIPHSLCIYPEYTSGQDLKQQQYCAYTGYCVLKTNNLSTPLPLKVQFAMIAKTVSSLSNTSYSSLFVTQPHSSNCSTMHFHTEYNNTLNRTTHSGIFLLCTQIPYVS